jgi:hypothetical protein
LGVLPLSPFSASDRHAFAGAHPQQVDLELSNVARMLKKKHLPSE